jgi:hypothetical protein
MFLLLVCLLVCCSSSMYSFLDLNLLFVLMSFSCKVYHEVTYCAVEINYQFVSLRFSGLWH